MNRLISIQNMTKLRLIGYHNKELNKIVVTVVIQKQ